MLMFGVGVGTAVLGGLIGAGLYAFFRRPADEQEEENPEDGQ